MFRHAKDTPQNGRWDKMYVAFSGPPASCEWATDQGPETPIEVSAHPPIVAKRVG